MAWYSMIQRCHDTKYRHYKHYGLKGVVVCDEWRNDYQKFLDWSLVNGWEKGLELDKDINGNGLIYSPLTCAWVTREENQAHRNRNLKKYTYRGCQYNLSQLAKIVGKSRSSLNLMINTMGKTVEDAVNSTPHIRINQQDADNIRKLKKRGCSVKEIQDVIGKGVTINSIYKVLNNITFPSFQTGTKMNRFKSFFVR